MDLFEKYYQGFAQSNTETMELLTKALTAGTGVDASAFTGGRALTPESLDFTLINILHNQDEARLFQRLKKTPIKSVVRQWNQRTEVGSDDAAWVPEGGDSVATDQTIARKFAVAKYLQTFRQVTLQAAMSDMVENAMAIEKEAGTLWLIRNIEKGLFHGDSSVVAEEPDGLRKLIPSTNVIDFRGGHADGVNFKKQITEALRIIRASYGKGDLMLASAKVTRDISNMLSDMYRIPLPPMGGMVMTQMGVQVGPGSPGGVPAAAFPMNFPTPFGNPEVLDDIFLLEGQTQVDTTVVTNKPSQCTISNGGHGADAASQFAAADAGSYYYKVTGVNRYGEGISSTAVQVTGVVAGDKVTFRVTPGGTVPAGLVIYRSKVGAADGTDCRKMFRIPFAFDSGPQTYMTVTDYNADLPGCSDVYMLTMNPLFNAVEWFQFLPMMKFDLYPVNAAVYPFLMLLFGGLGLLKPVQHVRIKNVCPTDGWF